MLPGPRGLSQRRALQNSRCEDISPTRRGGSAGPQRSQRAGRPKSRPSGFRSPLSRPRRVVVAPKVWRRARIPRVVEKRSVRVAHLVSPPGSGRLNRFSTHPRERLRARSKWNCEGQSRASALRRVYKVRQRSRRRSRAALLRARQKTFRRRSFASRANRKCGADSRWTTSCS